MKAAASVALLALTAAACGGSDSGSGADASAPQASDAAPGGPAGDPIRVGFINQERGALTFKEWGAGTRAGVEYVNNDLGGIDGRPLELVECTTDGTPESSSSCATELIDEGVPFIFNGVDLGNASAHPILDGAGVPLIGVVPFSAEDFASATSVWMGAMIDYVGAEPRVVQDVLGADSAVFVATDPNFVPAAQTALGLNQLVAETIGLDLELVFFNPADSGTFPAAATQAVAKDPDVIYILNSDDVATGMVQAILDAGWEKPLLAGNALDFRNALGDQAEGVYAISQFFQNPQGAPEDARADIEAYYAAMEEYAPDVDATGSFAQGGFVEVVTTAQIISDVGVDNLTGGSLVAEFREDTDRHLFMSTTFNCVTNSIPLAPGICGRGVQTIQWNGSAWDSIGEPVTVIDIVNPGE